MSFMSSSIKSHFQTDVRSAMRFSPLILLTIFFKLPQKGGSCDSEMDYILDNYYDDDDDNENAAADDDNENAAADDDNCNEVSILNQFLGLALLCVQCTSEESPECMVGKSSNMQKDKFNKYVGSINLQCYN